METSFRRDEAPDIKLAKMVLHGFRQVAQGTSYRELRGVHLQRMVWRAMAREVLLW